MIVEEREELRDGAREQPGATHASLLQQLLDDEKVPLLVVPRGARLEHVLRDAARKGQAPVHVGHRDVGHALPRLVGYAGDQLEGGELREREPTSIDEVHDREEHARQEPDGAGLAVEGFERRGAQRLGVGEGVCVHAPARGNRHATPPQLSLNCPARACATTYCD